MKITDVTTRVLSTPAESPLVFGRPEAVARHDFVTLELGTGVRVTYFGSALIATLFKLTARGESQLRRWRRRNASIRCTSSRY